MSLSFRQNTPRPAYLLPTIPKTFKQTKNKLYNASTSQFHHQIFRTLNQPTRVQLPTASVTMPKQKVRTYTKADETPVEKLASSLASAFEEDPFFRYFFDYPHGSKDVDILAKHYIMMLSTLKLELSRPDGQTTVHVSEDDSTVAVWHHVNHWQMPFMMQLLYVVPLFRTFGWRAIRFMGVVQHVDSLHPTKPHMHLFIIGTHAANRGRGIGSTVISKMLELCDRNGVPAYLDSTNERNLPFYRRHGFELVGKIPGLPEDCPPLFAMWRDPKPASDT